MLLEPINGKPNVFIGKPDLDLNCELFLAEAKRTQPSMVGSAETAMNGERLRTFAPTINQSWKCSSAGLTPPELELLNGFAIMNEPIWFIDSVAYNFNAMPRDLSLMNRRAIRERQAETGEYLSFEKIEFGVLPGDGSLLPSATVFYGPTDFSLTVPAFRDRDYNFSAYIKGQATVGVDANGTSGGSADAWTRLEVAGSTSEDQHSLNLHLSGVMAVSGLQLTWGSRECKAFSTGLATNRGFIEGLDMTHENHARGIFTPVSFDIVE